MKVPLSVFSALPELGNEVHLYTSMITSKTDISLVGFTDEQQRICFNLLVSVSGCGIKNSLSILSDLTPGQVYRAIAENNNAAISKVKSVGKKLSQRIVLELNSKIKSFAQEDLEMKADAISDKAQMAIGALISLGFKKKEAEAAINRVNPKFCVNPFEVRIEQSLFAAAAGLSSCLLINRITPEGLDVKGDEAFISP